MEHYEDLEFDSYSAVTLDQKPHMEQAINFSDYQREEEEKAPSMQESVNLLSFSAY